MAKKQATKKKVTPNTAKAAQPDVSAPRNLKELVREYDVLLMLYPKGTDGYFTNSIRTEDERKVYRAIREKKDKKEKLLVFLDTSGGNVYTAMKIMDTFRQYYKSVTIAVAQQAKSSGTMMCCGADKLIMSPISELGPLDKPMTHPNDETSTISALDIVKSIDGMIDTAVTRQLQMADEICNERGVPMPRSLEISSKAIAELITPMLCREDVKVYNQAQRLLSIAETYCEEFLSKYMLGYITNTKLKEKVCKLLVRQLVWLYPDHAFAIRRSELEDWFFIIEKSENVEYWDELWDEYEKNIGNTEKMIKYLSV